jgi:hypothetical protein
MILPRQDIAWVKSDDGGLAPFDAQRLADSIQSAACRAGQSDWWPAECIAAAVQLFACEELADQTIAAHEITDIVTGLLTALGFHEMSRAYAHRCRRGEIRLDEIATDSAGGFELDFFQRLDVALSAVTDDRLELLQVRGLRTCVMRLRGARHWGGTCRALAEDIVSHVRNRVLRVRAGQTAVLRLAVLD